MPLSRKILPHGKAKITSGAGSSVTGLNLNGTTLELNQSNSQPQRTVSLADLAGDITGVTAGDGLTGGGDSGAVTLAVGAGTGIDVAANAISVDVSDFMTNGSDNRIVTATGTDAMNAEANLTFDGSTLDLSGSFNTNSNILVAGYVGRDTHNYIDFGTDNQIKFRVNDSMSHKITTSSSNVVFQPLIDGKDFIFNQYDGNEVLRLRDNQQAKFSGSVLTEDFLQVDKDGSPGILVGEAGDADIYYDGTDMNINPARVGSGILKIATDTTIAGNLTVQGTTTTIDSTTLSVKDKNIEMGVVTSPTDVTADGGGITLKGTTDKTFNWIDSTDSWTASEHIELASGKSFRINGNNVLNQTTLGSTVVSSSLTSLGTLTALTGGTGDLNWDSGTLFVDSSTDRVGIGTSSPSNKLNINTGAGTFDFKDYNITYTTSLGIRAEGSGYLGLVTEGANDVFISTNGFSNKRLVVKSDGKVGIGTTAPQQPLHVLTSANDTGILIDVSDDSHEGRLLFGDTSSNAIGYIGYNHSLDAMRFFTNGSESLRLESDQDAKFYGKLGIGTTPSTSLHIAGSGDQRITLGSTSSNSSRLILSSDGGSDRIDFSLDGVGNMLAMTETGRIGIGTTSPSKSFHVAGTAKVDGEFFSSGGGDFTAGSYRFRDGVLQAFGTDRDVAWTFDNTNDRLLLVSGNSASNTTLIHIGADPTDGMYVAGNLGLGTTSPLGSIHIDGGAYQQVFTRGSHNHTIVKGNSDDTLTFATGAPGSHTARFKIKPTGIDVVNDAIITGSVGIGTSAPNVKLDVVGDARIRGSNKLYFGDTDTTEYISTAGTDDLRIHASDTVVIDGDGKSMFRTPYLALETSAASEKMRFDIDNGRFGIGTNAPGAQLDIHQTADDTALEIAGYDDKSGVTAKLHVRSNGLSRFQGSADAQVQSAAGSIYLSSTEHMYLDVGTRNTYSHIFRDDTGEFARFKNARLGIGTTAPGSKLDIVSTSNDNTGGIRIGDGSTFAAIYHDSSENLIIDPASDFIVTGSDDVRIQSSDDFELLADDFYFKNDADSSTMMRITSAGNVGIGTSAPSKKLEVVGHISASSSTATDAIYFSNGNAMMYNNNTHHFFYGGDTSTRWIANDGSSTFMSLMNSGKLGIGDTNPTRHLTVDSASIDIVALFKSTDNRASIQLSDDDTNRHIVTENSAISLGPNSSLHSNNLNIVGSPADVGIGTTSPSYTVDVVRNEADHNYVAVTNTSAGTSSVAGFRAHSQTADLFLLGNADNRTTTKFGIAQGGYSQITTANGNGLLFGNTQSAPIIFGTNDTERMRIDSAGNVGIGTNSPSQDLHVVGNGLFTGGLTVGDSAADTFITRGHTHLATLGNNVGIGTTSPDSLLEISTDAATDHLKLTSEGSTANPIKLIFEKSASEQGIIEFNRNGDLELYNTDNDGGVMIDGSASGGGDFYVNNAGNVGIGTTSPGSLLDVKGTVNLQSGHNEGIIIGAENNSTARNDNTVKVARVGMPQYDIDDGNFCLLHPSVTQYDNYIRYGGGTSAMDAATQHIWYTATSVDTSDGTERMRILSDGKIGIGTSAPARELHVAGDIIATNSVYFGDGNSPKLVKNGTNDIRFFTSGNSAAGTSVRAMLVGTSYGLDPSDNSIYIMEKSSAGADTANFGQIWVKQETPNKLFFTDDAGTDHDLTASGGSPGGSNTQLQYNNGGSFGGIDDLVWDGDKLILGDSSDTGNYLLVEGSDSENTYNVFEGKRRYPRIRLTDTSANKTMDIWNLGSQLRFGSNAGSSTVAAMFVQHGVPSSGLSYGSVTMNSGVMMGTTSPINSARLSIVDTTRPLVLGYDGSNYVNFEVSNSGDFTIDAPDDIRLDAGGGDIVLRDDGSEYARLSNSSQDFIIQNTQNDKDIIFKTVDNTTTTEVMRIDGSESRVGIGTSSPASPLDVKSASTDSTPFRVTRSANANLLAQVYEDSSGDGTFALYDDAQNGDIILRTGGNTIFNNNGNFGIGTTAPNEKLEVNGNIAATNIASNALITAGTGLNVAGGTLSTPSLTMGVAVTEIKDEDNMASNSATMLATQQSIKAYVDSQVAGGGGGAVTSYTNSGDNRILTSVDSSTINGEANLTFDGENLSLEKISGQAYSGKINFNDNDRSSIQSTLPGWLTIRADGAADSSYDGDIYLVANQVYNTTNDLRVGTNDHTDIAMTWNGASNDGVLTWMEDEDYFQFSDDILLSTTEKIQFNDTGTYIHSSADGQVNIIADVGTTIGNSASGGFAVAGNVVQSLNVDTGNFAVGSDHLMFFDGSATGVPKSMSNLDYISDIAGAGLLANNGQLEAVGGPSDSRLKSNVSDFTYGLDEIKQLTPKYYNYDKDKFDVAELKYPRDDSYFETQRVGLMADNVKSVMPEITSKIDSTKDYETYDKDALISVLINSVKELEDRIAQLESKL